MDKSFMCLYDEAFTKDEMLEETCRCSVCTIEECLFCGKMCFDGEVLPVELQIII